MAYYGWRKRPLTDEPMVRVVKRTFGNGRVRFVLMFYEGVHLANYREELDWREGRSYRSEKRANGIANRLAKRRMAQTYKDEKVV